MSQNMADSCSALSTAQHEHNAAVARETAARKEVTAALNRLNECQRAVDKAVDEMRGRASRDSNWGTAGQGIEVTHDLSKPFLPSALRQPSKDPS